MWAENRVIYSLKKTEIQKENLYLSARSDEYIAFVVKCYLRLDSLTKQQGNKMLDKCILTKKKFYHTDSNKIHKIIPRKG